MIDGIIAEYTLEIGISKEISSQKNYSKSGKKINKIETASYCEEYNFNSFIHCLIAVKWPI